MDKFNEKLKGIGKSIKDKFKSIESNLLKIKNNEFEEVFNNKKTIMIACTILIVIFGIIFINILPTSKNDALEGFKKSLIEGKEEKLSTYIRVNNKEVSAKKLEPLIKYYDGNENMVNSLISDLNQKGKSGVFTLESKKKFFKEKYYISMGVTALDFTSNIEGVEISILDKKYNLEDKTQYFVLPGLYDIAYTLETKYGDIKGRITVSAMEDQKVDIDVDAQFITIYSNFNDADVYINGENILLKAQEIKSYGPLPKDNNLTLYLQREFPWGVIKSEEVSLDKEPFIKLDINMVNDELTSIISETTNSFYDSTFEALNKKDKELISNATEAVKKSVYEYINEKTLLLSNNYDITDLQVEIEKSDFKYEDEKYKASLVTKIKYNVSKKMLPFIKTPNESSFLLSLEYDKDRFIVNGIQKIDI